MADDVTITVRVDNQTGPGITSVNATVNRMGSAAKDSEGAFKDLRATLLSLAPAAVPVAAAIAPIAVKTGAAAVAVAAFGAALVPQLANLKSAAQAQDKYTAAVTKYGAGSKQAIAAQQLAADTLATMPAATQRAAAAYSVLSDQFHAFSDSNAKFTMKPVTDSFAVVGALLPKLTPMVQSTSTQFDRLIKVAGGAINTSGFDAMSKKVSDFANQSLTQAVSGATHLIRVLSEGNAKGPIADFMSYAKAEGPAVKELLSNLVSALGNIVKGAAEAGPGMLTLVNAFAKLVAAAPPQLIGNLMQIAAAFKLIKLAGAGVSAISAGFASLSARVAQLQAASTAAGGGLAALRAAFLGLGTAAKATVVVAGLTAVALVMMKLSSIGKSAPPDIDRMTTSLGNLANTGKVSGEALRVFGSNLSGLSDSLRTLSRPSNLDKTQQFLTSLIGMDSTPVKDAKTNLDAVDKSLANLVKDGKADLAKQAFDDIAKSMEKQGLTSKELKSKMDDYKSALADQALEAKLTAQSMGLFGDAAQATQAKLDAQKASADGLRQSLQALNDVNRQGLGGMIAFQQSIADAATAAKANAGALSMTGGQLNLSSQKARDAASALQDLADKTDAAAASARESGSSWETVNGIYAKGRSNLISFAEQMGLSASQAKTLADQILQVPNKSVTLKMNDEDAVAGLNSFNSALRATPGAKSVTLKTLSSSAEAVLSSFGYKVTHLPNGSVRVSAAAGQALAAIGNVQGAVNSLHDKTITIMTQYFTANSPSELAAAHGRARGGLAPGYASGGHVVQTHPNGGLVSGPGSDTSDSIMELSPNGGVYRTSNREYIVQASAVRKYGTAMLDRLNAGQLHGYAKGGLTQAQKDARSQLSGDFGISYFGRVAGYQRTPFERNIGAPQDTSSLVDSLNGVAGQIRAAFTGRTESSLINRLASVGRSLIGYEKKLTDVTSALSSAKDKLNSLKDSASQLASSVKSSLISSANITKATSNLGGGPITLSSVQAGMIMNRDKVVAFADALKRLKAKGYSASIIQQVAEAGVDGGGLETAGALLEASASEVSSMNKTQSTIESAAGAAGSTTADSVYGAQIAAQEKYVKTLTAQQSSLEKAMSKLASTMEKAIKSALSHRAAGGVVGAAASGGLRGGLTMVGEQGIELLDLPAGSRVFSNPDTRRMLSGAQAPWASMLNAPRRATAGYAPAAAGPAASGQPLVIQVRIGEKDFGELWVDTGRRAVRARGSIEATLRPPRGR